MATMLKRDTAAVMQCIRGARGGRAGSFALCRILEQVASIPKRQTLNPFILSCLFSLIIEQWLNEVTLESISQYEWKLRAVAMAQLLHTDDPEVGSALANTEIVFEYLAL